MKITEEELNAYRRKHHLPVPPKGDPKQSAELDRLRQENIALRYEIADLKHQIQTLNSSDSQRKWWCRQETRRLIKQGAITIKPCAICGDTNVHIHHPDYDDPYYIQCLCPRHHYELHYRQCLEKGEDGSWFKTLLDQL